MFGQMRITPLGCMRETILLPIIHEQLVLGLAIFRTTEAIIDAFWLWVYEVVVLIGHILNYNTTRTTTIRVWHTTPGVRFSRIHLCICDRLRRGCRIDVHIVADKGR